MSSSNISKEAQRIIDERSKKKAAKANAKAKRDLRVSNTKRNLKQKVSDAVTYKNKMTRGKKELEEALKTHRKEVAAEIKEDERTETIGSRMGGRSQREGQTVGNRIKFFKFHEKNKLKK